jgi:nitrite reductase (NADH) small subunit
MTKKTICKIDDLIPNSGVCALVNDEQVALFYVPTATPAVYGIGNWDPLGKANVLSRGIVGDIKGELVVASPLYKQHFSLNSGKCLEDETARVKTYPVAVEGDLVVLLA